MHGPRMHGRAQDAETIRKRVARMAKAGRVTPEEAERVFAASSPDELERAVREIRVRHARAQLGKDVQDGRLTKDEADHFMQRLQSGEDVRLPSRFRRRNPPHESAAPPQPPSVESGQEPLDS